MYCSNCGKSIPDQSSFCPVCGAPVQKAGNPKPVVNSPRGNNDVSAIIDKIIHNRKYLVIGIAAVVAVLLLILIIIPKVTPGGDGQSEKREAKNGAVPEKMMGTWERDAVIWSDYTSSCNQPDEIFIDKKIIEPRGLAGPIFTHRISETKKEKVDGIEAFCFTDSLGYNKAEHYKDDLELAFLYDPDDPDDINLWMYVKCEDGNWHKYMGFSKKG